MGSKRLSIFLKGVIAENPVLVLVLGTCPALAQTGSVVNAFGMGIATTIVLISSNAVISALRRVIPNSVRIPCYIVVIAGFVTAVQLVMRAELPGLYDRMGLYLALIVVNCIILGRAEMYARKNSVLDSALDGAGMGVGFLVALVAMAAIRETLGSGSFAGVAIPFLKDYTIPLLAQAPGGFFVFGLLIAAVNKIGPRAGKEKRRNFSCSSCHAASYCASAEHSSECEGKGV